MGNCQKDEQQIRQVKVVPAKSFLYIKCNTWKKDYQGLYDYQSKQIQKQDLKITQSGLVIKQKKNALNFLPGSSMTNEVIKAFNSGLKFNVIRHPKIRGFGVSSIKIVENQETIEKSIWQVVKSMPNKKYYLKEGDVIKLGRQKFKIKQKVLKEIALNKQQQEVIINTKQIVYQNLTKQYVQAPTPISTNQQQQIVCRICLDPGLNDNPIITPCKCQGYLKYIHLNCLKTWLGKRLEPIIKNYSIIINWKPLVCELCTSHFMYKVYLDGKKYYTVEIPKPNKPYIVLEILNKSNQTEKYYNLISFSEKQKLNLGRKHDIDIRISDDISVSRHHAIITYDSKVNEFILEDNSSKFGTLVLRKKIKILEKNSSMFQVGPNLFYVKMIKGLNQPEEDGSDSENEKSRLGVEEADESDNSSYEESQSEEAQDIQPEDLSPTVPKNMAFIDHEGSRPTVLMRQAPIPAQSFNNNTQEESFSPKIKLEQKAFFEVEPVKQEEKKQQREEEKKQQEFRKQKQRQKQQQKIEQREQLEYKQQQGKGSLDYIASALQSDPVQSSSYSLHH